MTITIRGKNCTCNTFAHKLITTPLLKRKGNSLLEDITIQKIESTFDEPIYFTGPEINDGIKPAFFYFALSGKQSLQLDPYNQPIQFLNKQNVRCFSWSLPFHNDEIELSSAMPLWIETWPAYFTNYTVNWLVCLLILPEKYSSAIFSNMTSSYSGQSDTNKLTPFPENLWNIRVKQRKWLFLSLF